MWKRTVGEISLIVTKFGHKDLLALLNTARPSTEKLYVKKKDSVLLCNFLYISPLFTSENWLHSFLLLNSWIYGMLIMPERIIFFFELQEDDIKQDDFCALPVWTWIPQVPQSVNLLPLLSHKYVWPFSQKKMSFYCSFFISIKYFPQVIWTWTEKFSTHYNISF